MVLEGAKVHKYVSIQHCHNFLYMMHLWKIAYDVIIVSIEMLNVTLASISVVLQHKMQELVLDLDFILSLNEMFGMNHI